MSLILSKNFPSWRKNFPDTQSRVFTFFQSPPLPGGGGLEIIEPVSSQRVLFFSMRVSLSSSFQPHFPPGGEGEGRGRGWLTLALYYCAWVKKGQSGGSALGDSLGVFFISCSSAFSIFFQIFLLSSPLSLFFPSLRGGGEKKGGGCVCWNWVWERERKRQEGEIGSFQPQSASAFYFFAREIPLFLISSTREIITVISLF